MRAFPRSQRPFRALTIIALLIFALAPAAPMAHAAGPTAWSGPFPDLDGRLTRPGPKPAHRRLDSELNRLIDQLGQRAAADIAADAPRSRGAAVAVSIRTVGDQAGLLSWLSGRGAHVVNIGVDAVEAYVPIEALADLNGQPGAASVRLIAPAGSAVVSQGAALHGAPGWNAAGYGGAGVKVGVIDGGFQGYRALIGSELLAPAVVRCYIAVGSFTADPAACENGNKHGTAVAEAVVDVAPQVTLYLATPDSTLDLQQTVAWMAAQGVQVINHSLYWNWDGPGDGLSPSAASPLRSVDAAVAAGILWVNSAGNMARSTWTGPYADGDGDGLVDIVPGGEANPVTVAAGDEIQVQARWEDSWTAAGRDIDLLLFNSSLSLVAWGDDAQDGAPGQIPYETFRYRAPQAGVYYVVLDRYGGAAPAWLQVQLFRQQEFGLAAAPRSIDNPAESRNPGLLAVGAANWRTPTAIEPISSQGPTADGRVKPDIVGADCGASATFSVTGFCGTSQAAPHLAGLAALVRQRFPSLAPAQVATYLKDNAVRRGSATPNTIWGAGFAALPAPPGAQPLPTTTWYFAEGYTGAGFDEYLTIQNPNPQAASLQITYYLNGDAPIVKGLTVGPTSRATVAVHDPVQGVGRGREVATRVVSTNGVGVVVERPMYFTYLGGVNGGHNVMGVQAPRQSWLFAEGYTGAGFDEYLTILNPNASPAPVTITYFLGGGQAPVVKGMTVPAASRATVAVHDPAQGVGRNQEVSAKVETSLAGGIVVERPIYFTYGGSIPGATGGHDVMGAAAPRTTWLFPDGVTEAGYDEYLTLMNAFATAAQARLTYYVVGESAPRTKVIVVPANSRATVAVHDPAQGVGRGLRHGTKVESLNGVGLVVERPMYFRYTGAIDGGHNVMGASAPATTWLFAEGYTGTGFDEELVVLNPNGQTASVTITYYLNGGAPIARSLMIAPLSRASVPVYDLGQAGRGKEVSAKVASTNGVGIVAERPIYFVYNGTIDGGHTVMGFAP